MICEDKGMLRLAALLLSLAALPAVAATAEEDLKQYLMIFEQSSKMADAAVDDLAWKGISDTRLFDRIEQQMLADSRGLTMNDRVQRNHVARQIKALGYSGQAKYEPTLTSLATDYRRPVERALISLKLYARWNPIISSRATWDPKYSDDVNRVRNMLNSDDLQLQALGAKRVFFANSSEPMLMDMLAERLRACYKTVDDPDGVEAAGWMVNGLGRSQDAKHVALIREVAAGAASTKLRTRAEKNLRP